MKAFKKDPRTGYVMEINTDGNYICKGWSRTKELAEKRKIK